MNMLITAVRRALLLALIGAAAGALWRWQQDRNAPSTAPTPPEWPPMTTAGGVTAAQPSSATGTITTITTPEPSEGVDADAAPDDEASTADTGADTETSAGVPSGESASTTSIVNALVDAPDARSDDASGDWVAPNDDGNCPATHPIKANDNSGIYHVPGGTFYDRTRAERCYTSAEAAAADGYRPAKS